MSADGLARFVLSPEGEAYRRVCELSGVDPGAPLVEVDDVLAHDFRMALLVARPDEEPVTPGEEGRVVTDLFERMQRA